MEQQTDQQLQEVVELLKSRGISIAEIVEVLQEVQSSHTELSSEEAAAAIKKVLVNPVVQESLFIGLELDRLAEEEKLSEPLRTIIRSDESLFGIDETLALVPIFEQGLDAFSELGHRDNHKIGIIKRLDSTKDHVNTFADDLVTMVVTMADSDLIKDKQIPMMQGDLSVAQSTSMNRERVPFSQIKQKAKNRVPTEEVRKAAMQRLEDRDLTIERIADAVFSKQHNYNPLLNMKGTRQQAKEVLGLGRKELRRNPHAREIYHVILALTELEDLANRGELSEPLMRRIEANRTDFRPSRGIALLATGLNGSIAMTRNGYSTQHPYSSLPQPTTEGPINLFTVDMANMLVSNVMGRTAHTQRYIEENGLSRFGYGVGTAVHTGRNKVRQALKAGVEVTSKVIKPHDKQKHNPRIHS